MCTYLALTITPGFLCLRPIVINCGALYNAFLNFQAAMVFGNWLQYWDAWKSSKPAQVCWECQRVLQWGCLYLEMCFDHKRMRPELEQGELQGVCFYLGLIIIWVCLGLITCSPPPTRGSWPPGKMACPGDGPTLGGKMVSRREKYWWEATFPSRRGKRFFRRKHVLRTCYKTMF